MEAIYRANAAGLHALLPSVTPIQVSPPRTRQIGHARLIVKHADFSHNCSNCSETGDHRIMGPCHCGPFALAHGAIRTYRDHLGTISHRHGQLRREPSQLAQVLGPAVAVGGASVPLGSIAIPGQVIGVAASILIYALADVRCVDCGGRAFDDGCRAVWSCCLDKVDAYGCSVVSRVIPFLYLFQK